MGYFSLTNSSKTLAIKSKKRIQFIVPFKVNEIIVFYQDGIYQHIHTVSQNTIHEGQLDFVATECLISPHSLNNKIFIKGTSNINNEKHIILAMLNIYDENFKPYEVQIFSDRKQLFPWAKYEVVKSENNYKNQESQIIIIQTTPNIQNGLKIECLDVNKKVWSQQLLHLGSKFLNCKLIRLYSFQKLNNCQQCTFLLVANGDKCQSINICKISVVFKNSENTNTKSQNDTSKQPSSVKLKIDFVKEVKLFRNFTILGGYSDKQQNLFLTGNSTSFEGRIENTQLWQPVCVIINLASLENNIQSKTSFRRLQNFKFGKQIVMRHFLGQINGDILFVAENNIKKSIHKISTQRLLMNKKKCDWDEQVTSLNNQFAKKNCLLSLDKQGIISYELVCEQFFEKIKDSPSVIKFNNYLMTSKSIYYANLLENIVPKQQKDQKFIKQVLSLL